MVNLDFILFIDQIIINKSMEASVNSYSELYALNSAMIHLMLELEECYEKLLLAIRERNADTMHYLIDNDVKINKMRDVIEEKCLVLLLREHPYARDLRNVLSVFKIVTEAERIGDQIRDIAECLIMSEISKNNKLLDKLLNMADNIGRMMNAAIKSFGAFDSELAEQCCDFDDAIDAQYLAIKQEIITVASQNTHGIFDILSAVKHFEKIGDHLVNIAEWVNYIVTAHRKISNTDDNK